ncbi:MAG: alpha/beta hydrolase family protein [Bryobacteraceae bacterium]
MLGKFTRRQLGLAAASALAQENTPVKYTGALDGYESKVAPAQFDPVLWTRDRYTTIPRQLAFRARTRKEAEAWQKRLRTKLNALLGGLPEDKPPLQSQTLEVRDFPGYRREKFVFESRPGFAVLGYLLTPRGAKRPYTPVICLPGHGRGVDDIVGIDDHGRDRTTKDGYQHDFAIQVVEHNMAAVAIEMMAFGCRRDPATRKRGLGASACQPSAGAALLFGETMITWRVHDVMRTVDWIETRPELDRGRVGCMGISGGGTCTRFAAALEPRIRAAMMSCSLNTFRDSIMSISHCIDNYVPGILHWAEMYDVAGLIAPRPFFAESGDRDPIFPLAASRESFERVQEMYEVFHASGETAQEVFSGNHMFHGVEGLKFLADKLGAV